MINHTNGNDHYNEKRIDNDYENNRCHSDRVLPAVEDCLSAPVQLVWYRHIYFSIELCQDQQLCFGPQRIVNKYKHSRLLNDFEAKGWNQTPQKETSNKSALLNNVDNDIKCSHDNDDDNNNENGKDSDVNNNDNENDNVDDNDDSKDHFNDDDNDDSKETIITNPDKGNKGE